jgi:hypothetical protein
VSEILARDLFQQGLPQLPQLRSKQWLRTVGTLWQPCQWGPLLTSQHTASRPELAAAAAAAGVSCSCPFAGPISSWSA